MEAIGRLAGGVAHDFNNLLTVMLGYCELLLEDLDERDPRRPDVAAIRRAGERAAELTRQLLTFSRKQIIEPALLDLNAVVTGMRPMLERLIGENVKVVVDLAWHRVRQGGSRAAGAGRHEPLGERPRCHAALRHADDRNRQRRPRRALRGDAPRGDTGAACGAFGDRHGNRHVAEVQARLFEPFFTTKEVGKGMASVSPPLRHACGAAVRSVVQRDRQRHLVQGYLRPMPRTPPRKRRADGSAASEPRRCSVEDVTAARADEKAAGATRLQRAAGGERRRRSACRAERVDDLFDGCGDAGCRGPELTRTCFSSGRR
jgi:hypothetical protein